jgi:glycosyltransferase involved in cell wall biosynthesis
MTPQILQICPHDSMPFGGLCKRYEQAAGSLGYEVTTVFLAPATDKPYDYASYLDAHDLADTNSLSTHLNEYGNHAWDLILCHRYRAYWAVAKSRLSNNPAVVLAHEYDLLSRWQRRLNRRIFAPAFRFAGVAAQVADALGRVTGESLVLPNVLDTDSAESQLLSKAEALDKLELVPGPLTIGVVGRLHYKKQPMLALQAFRLFSETHAEARLVFLGDGEEAQQLKNEAGSNVYFPGPIPNAARLFSGFDMLLHTASAEPFGMVVLEALFAGVPVVTHRNHGPLFVLGELGVYTDDATPQGFSEALQRASKVDAASYKTRGRERVEREFSVTALARHLQHLIK